VLRTANVKEPGARLDGAERFAPSRLRKFDFNFLSQAEHKATLSRQRAVGFRAGF